MRVLVFSYCPLMRVTPTNNGIANIRSEQDIKKFMKDNFEGLPDGTVDSCLWQNDNGELAAALIIDRADEIAEHLVEWADDEPEKWFRLYFAERHGHYAMVLFPNSKRALSRFHFRYLMEPDTTPLNLKDAQIICRPLNYISGKDHMFDRAKGVLKESKQTTIAVSLIDPVHVRGVDLGAIDQSKFRPLGRFRFALPDGSFPGNGADKDDCDRHYVLDAFLPSLLNQVL